MAVITTANFSNLLSWAVIDTNTHSRVVDIGEVSSDVSFVNYTGSIPVSINSIWYESGILSSGGSHKVDLLAMSRDVFGEPVAISMSKIHAVIIKNASQVIGEDFSVAATGSTPFNDIFGGGNYIVPVYPASALGFNNPLSGWDVDGTNNELFLVDGGQGCSYEIAVIGISG